MRLSLSQSQILDQRICLSHSQKLQLKQLLAIRQYLKEPEFPYAERGLEGMVIADSMLKQRGSVGVLIGGLSEEVWNQRRKPEDLYKHKDVDVAVLDDKFELEKDFEGGIDWWLPETGKINLKGDFTEVQGIEKTWYQNGNGINLRFGFRYDKNSDNKLTPGLYIMGPEEVKGMRMSEALASVDSSVEIDEDVTYRLSTEIGKTMKTRVPKFVAKKFSGQILSWDYCSMEQRRHMQQMGSHIHIDQFDHEMVVGINSYNGSCEEPVVEEN